MLTPRLFDASVFLGPDDASDFIGGVLEASTEYSFIATDLDGLIRLWNQGAQRTYGYDPDEVLGRMSSFDLHIPEDVESGRAAQILATVLDAGKWEGTINRKRKNGDRFLARVVQTPRMDDGGKPIGFLVISKDISEEVRLTKEMVYNRSLIEASLDAQFAIGLDGSITDVNEEATRVTGYARDHLTKLQFSTLFTEPADAAAALRCALDELRVRGFELELETATGETICVSFNAGVFVDASGETAGILVAARDVTGSKDDERAVRGAREESDRANAAKSEFLSRMSHELRTPLNAILGFTQLLELDALQPCSAEKVEQISRAGKQLLGLINEVLDISRIEAGHLVQTAQPVAVSQLLDESADLVRALAERYGVTVSRDDGDGIFVLADRQRLVQVMLNLLSNGIKYNTRGGSVKLSHDQADGRVKIAVADTGVGLPPDRLEELFVPFNRLGVDSTETEGSGLGLALSKVLVEAMGGTLTLASTSPMGSEFVVELPATDVSPGWVPVVARVSAAAWISNGSG